jgi:hypothetical protein
MLLAINAMKVARINVSKITIMFITSSISIILGICETWKNNLAVEGGETSKLLLVIR